MKMKKGTCLGCSEGHKNSNYFDAMFLDEFGDLNQYRYDDTDKMVWVCRNCHTTQPRRRNKSKARDEKNARFEDTLRSLTK